MLVLPVTTPGSSQKPTVIFYKFYGVPDVQWLFLRGSFYLPLLVDLLVMRGVIQAIDGVMPATHWRVSLQAILER
jgi:hypothetical protein